MAFRERLDKNEADLTSTTQNLDDAALPCRAAGERLHAQSPAHSQSLRNLLCALEHYAISCAPSIIFDHLDALRAQTAVVLHPLARCPQHTRRPQAREEPELPHQSPYLQKKRLPQMGEPLQIACSYAAPAAGRAGSTDLPSPTPLHPPERGTQRRLSGPTPPSGQRPARLSPSRTPQRWPCPCRSTCNRPDGRQTPRRLPLRQAPRTPRKASCCARR